MDASSRIEASDSGCGCGVTCPPASPVPASSSLVKLPIMWQRLVSEGQTCQRCGSTQEAIEHAMVTLTEALRPLGIEPELETRALDQAAFEADPSESNRIWIAGRPIEAWIGAQVGASPCCSVCGDSPCRTVEVDGTTYEAIPERLLVRAAMVAAAGMLTA